jgi:hypothetical protein
LPINAKDAQSLKNIAIRLFQLAGSWWLK